MIELRVLGSLEVDGLPANHGRALLAQTKGLALLTYLVLAPDGRGRGRDDLSELLWPDSTPTRARGALRAVLHALRRNLGAGVAGSYGKQIRVDPAKLRSDASRFDQLLTEARPVEAVELYRGDLLPGFTVAGAPSFNRWLDARRDELRARASDACWQVAEVAEHEGHWVTAADHARKGARWSRNPEHDARRLMALLHRAGDRVAALREYEAFAQEWWRQYGLKPSPETSALAEAIREGAGAPSPPGASTMRGRTVGVGSGWGPPHAPPRIAVLPFQRVGGDPESDALATGLADGVISTLSRVSGVRVVARASVDRLAGTRGEDAMRIGEKLGADLILDGSMRVSEDGFAVAVRLIDAARDVPLWGDLYEAGRSELLPLQSSLVLRVLEVLDVELSPDEERHLVRPPTTSHEAYELYLRGRRLWNRRSATDAAAAIELYERALALDPGFALAMVGLADAYLTPAGGRRFAEGRIRGREALRQALDIDPRLGEAHATLGLLRGVFDRDWHGAETELLRGIELNPGYATAHHWYGGVLSWVFERFAEGARELELARQLDPLSPVIRSDIGMALLNRGRVHQAMAKFREALEIDSDFWRAHFQLGVAACLAGDPAGAPDHFRRAWRIGAWGAPPEPADDPRNGEAEAPGSWSWRHPLEARLRRLEGDARRPAMRGFEGAVLSALLGESGLALEWLGISEREGTAAFVLQYYPAFSGLEDHPGFQAFVEARGARRTPGVGAPG